MPDAGSGLTTGCARGAGADFPVSCKELALATEKAGTPPNGRRTRVPPFSASCLAGRTTPLVVEIPGLAAIRERLLDTLYDVIEPLQNIGSQFSGVARQRLLHQIALVFSDVSIQLRPRPREVSRDQEILQERRQRFQIARRIDRSRIDSARDLE